MTVFLPPYAGGIIPKKESLPASILGVSVRNYQAGGVAVSATHNLLARDNGLIVAAMFGKDVPANGISGVTYDTVAMTEGISILSGNLNLSLYFLLETDLPGTTGNKTVTATWDGGTDNMHIHVVAFQDVKQAAPSDTDSATAIPGTHLASTLTTVIGGVAISALAQDNNSGTWTPDAGVTELQDFVTGIKTTSAYLIADDTSESIGSTSSNSARILITSATFDSV